MLNQLRLPIASLLLAAAVSLLLLSSCGSDETADNPTPVEAADTVEAVEAVEVEPESSSTDTEVDRSASTSEAADNSPSDEAAASAAQPAGTGGVDLNLFMDGALVGQPTTVPCTLAGGTNAECYSITVVGSPVDGEVGPFCPRTTEATAEEVGIWFDGSGLYDLDGQFIRDLPQLYSDDNWQLSDDNGNVNVTETAEEFEAAARPDVDPALQNHCVEGRIEWLEGGEPIATSVEVPTIAVYTGTPTRVSGVVGVQLNGVRIDGPAPVDAILGAYTIAAFDDCGGHVNPGVGYHVHGATGCSEVGEAEPGDTPQFGYALDGFPIHSPLSDEQLAATELDECNGHSTEASGYHYHASEAHSNAVLSCFMGETASSQNQGGGAGRPDGEPPAREQGGAAAPDLEDAAQPAAQFDSTLGAPESAADYLGSYSLVDDTYGTMTSVTVTGDTRTIVSNSIPDHETGEFPNPGNPNTISEQSLVFEVTTEPTFVGGEAFAQMPGVAINGVSFEPGTGESVTCSSGETYRIEGLQDLFDLGMDVNNAHVQPTGKYHYHGISELLVANVNTNEDLVLVGFASPRYLMDSSVSGAWSPSWQLSSTPRTGSDCSASGPGGGTSVAIEGSDPNGTYGSDWTFVAGSGDLDACNGAEINGQYAYVLTAEYPFISRCLNGEYTGRGGPGAGAPGTDGQAPGAGTDNASQPEDTQPGDRAVPPDGPDFTDAAAALGVSVEELQAALGGPPPDFAAAAATLGVTVEELESILPAPPG